ncbi:UNVERIFIED_CONTAM: Auxilin-like protein 1, partial [Sesamum latifolium]
MTTAAVKKAQRKATLYLYPDKVQQRGATVQQTYICKKAFVLLKFKKRVYKREWGAIISKNKQDRISVDARMKQKGFSFPSKYQYCEAEETVPHLFVEGSAVQGVWKHFAHFFGLQICETGDVTRLVHVWRYSTSFHSDLHVRTLVPFLILWFTWTQRNAAKYDGVQFSTNNIIFETDGASDPQSSALERPLFGLVVTEIRQVLCWESRAGGSGG